MGSLSGSRGGEKSEPPFWRSPGSAVSRTFLPNELGISSFEYCDKSILSLGSPRMSLIKTEGRVLVFVVVGCCHV